MSEFWALKHIDDEEAARHVNPPLSRFEARHGLPSLPYSRCRVKSTNLRRVVMLTTKFAPHEYATGFLITCVRSDSGGLGGAGQMEGD